MKTFLMVMAGLLFLAVLFYTGAKKARENRENNQPTSSSPSTFFTPAPANNRIKVYREGFQPVPTMGRVRVFSADEWPLTVTSGEVERLPDNSVVFHHAGSTFALNGIATGKRQYMDVERIWRFNPDGSGERVNIGPLIDLGNNLK